MPFDEALAHLRSLDQHTIDFDPRFLNEEFVTKDDFRKWLIATGRLMPTFWFGPNEAFANEQSGD